MSNKRKNMDSWAVAIGIVLLGTIVLVLVSTAVSSVLIFAGNMIGDLFGTDRVTGVMVMFGLVLFLVIAAPVVIVVKSWLGGVGDSEVDK